MSDAARLAAYDRELSAVMPADFKDWHENSPDEWPIVARRVIESLRERAEWNAANAPPDPALLALARLGAMVLDWSPLECGFPTMPGGVIDDMAVRAGAALEDSGDGGHACWTAPSVRLAIARLLAPDGAREVTDD